MNGQSSRRQFLAQGGRWLALAGAGPALGGWWLGCSRAEESLGRRFVALGTEVTLVARGADRRQLSTAVQAATREVFAVHEQFTLFEPSPLQTLNRRATGRDAAVDGDLLPALEQARKLWRETAGHFDPGLALWTGPDPSRRAPPSVRQGFEAAELDAVRATLRLDAGRVALDLNGFAKGLAVDRAVAVLRRHGLRHFVVNAGGDLYAAGDAAADEQGWQIRIHDGVEDGIARAGLRLRDRAAATSGQASASWRRGAHLREHLLVPASGQAATQLRTTTVLASSAARADAWATALFVAPHGARSSLLSAQPALGAVLMTSGGELQRLGITT